MENSWKKYPDVRPTEYGKYEVYRQKCGKQQYQTWNNTGWAYDNNDITHWRKIISPIEAENETTHDVSNVSLPTEEEFKKKMDDTYVNKFRSSQFKKGMIAGFFETLDMLEEQKIKKNVSNVEPSKKELYYQQNFLNPYPSESQSATAYKKGFYECFDIFFKTKVSNVDSEAFLSLVDEIQGIIYKFTDMDDDTTWLPGDKIFDASLAIAEWQQSQINKIPNQ